MSQKFELPEPEYYTVNDRPVKILATPDGGKKVLVMNLYTGKFEPDMSYLSRCYNPEQDVDCLSAIMFNQYVTELKRQINQKNNS